MGFLFITDQDARPAGGIHPYAHLWDNGNDPVGELKRIGKLRAYSLKNMGSGTLPEGVPYSELEKNLVPVYLMHRYQVDAASKIIGGVDFSYNLKGEKTKAVEPLGVEMQKAALDALLETIQPEYLEIPKDLLQMISPPAFGYSRDRETFKGHTGSLFDHMGAAEASANHTLKFLLNAQRLSRLSNFNLKDFSLGQYFASLSTHIFGARNGNVQIIKMIQKLYFIHLMKISSSSNLSKDVVAHALFEMDQIKSKYLSNTKMNAHAFYLKKMSEDFLNDPDDYKLPEIPSLPPGSPIGCH